MICGSCHTALLGHRYVLPIRDVSLNRNSSLHRWRDSNPHVRSVSFLLLSERPAIILRFMKCAKCDLPFSPKHPTQRFCSSVCRAAYHSKRWSAANQKTCTSCGANCKHSSTICKLCQTGSTICRSKTVGDCKNSSEIRNFNRSWNKNLISLPCQVCGYSLHVELAHIKPISSFLDDVLLTVVNDPANILVLCRNHHWEQENGFLLLEQIPAR